MLLFVSILGFSQPSHEKAEQLAQKAIKAIDSKSYDEAIELLEQAHQLDSTFYRYRYEMAYAYYLKKDYTTALNIMKALAEKDNVNDKVYQLLGSLYDINGDTASAMKTYRTGLKKHPHSGSLLNEIGNYYYDKLLYNRAMAYYERGIEVAPDYASNYFRAAILYLSSKEEVWGMMYGELFLNMEPNTMRTKQMSKMLFETYNNEISIGDSVKVDFTSRDKGKGGFPALYEELIKDALKGKTGWGMEAYCTMRKTILTTFYEKGYDKQYGNLLFEYQKKILNAGHFDAYSHWVLIDGDKQSFNEWYDRHKAKIDAYAKWLGDNRLEVTKENAFNKYEFIKR